MNEGLGGHFGYSRSHGAAQKVLDTIIAGGWDLVFFSNVIYIFPLA